MCVEIVGAVEAITFQPLSRGREKLIFRRRTSVPFFSLFFFFNHRSYTIHIFSAPIRRTILPIVASPMSAFAISREIECVSYYVSFPIRVFYFA